jgi:hypothetical protein
MATEQDQKGWNDATSTFPSTDIFNRDDYLMQGLGDDDLPEDPDEMQRRWLLRRTRTPTTIPHGLQLYLPMLSTKDGTEPKGLRTQAAKTTASRSQEESLDVGRSEKAFFSS